MRARPDAAQLLAEAARLLRTELLPGVAAEWRGKLDLVADAIEIARRDALHSASLEQQIAALPPRLAQDIRAGRRDADAALFEALRAIARAELRITKPAASPE